MKDNVTPKRIMRRRGRPRKSPSGSSATRKTRTLRLTEEEVRLIAENAKRCRKNFMVSRFTVDGRINDTNLIGLKATMAANSIKQSMGWRQSQDISEEHKAEIKNALYGILRSMDKFDWDVFLRKTREHGYSAELRRDSTGSVVGYHTFVLRKKGIG